MHIAQRQINSYNDENFLKEPNEDFYLLSFMLPSSPQMGTHLPHVDQRQQ